MPEWQSTPDSSHVSEIAYSEEDSAVHVRFHDGDQYRYMGVPPEVFEQLRTSGSKGRFVAVVLRRGYAYEKE